MTEPQDPFQEPEAMESTGQPETHDGPDLEGCTDTRHCHRRRSSRQETAWTPEGKIRACHKQKGWGTSHFGYGPCRQHGGNTPMANRGAEYEQAQEAVQTLGLPKDIGPADALLQEIQYTAGHVEWFRRELQRLEAGELTWGMYRENVEPDIQSKDGDVITAQVTGEFRATPHVLYQMYMKERQHLANVCKMALDAGVNERIVRMYEQVGDTFVNLIENVLNRLELSDAQRRMVPAAVATELRILTGDVA